MTAALDTRAEHGILMTLRRITAGKMALIVTTACAGQAGREDGRDGPGRVVEVGTHRDLMGSGASASTCSAVRRRAT
jgi:ABC-type transport system involved in Fe-S cluster assembly fused permease/ATPase subunit